MPFAGIGLHMVLALLCAVHVVRTRQQLYWLFILFAFPLLGSAVYFFGVYLPNSRLERSAARAVSVVARAVDPTREVREARAVFEEAPSAQNQMRLAAALLEVGNAPEAAAQYEACLSGPFAKDPDIRFGAARALTECEKFVAALSYLEPLRAEWPSYRPEAMALLLARCYAGLSRSAQARAEFESAEARFGTFEVKAQYAIWAHAIGDQHTARRLDAELEKISSRWNALTRDLNAAVYRRYLATKEQAGRRASL